MAGAVAAPLVGWGLKRAEEGATAFLEAPIDRILDWMIRLGFILLGTGGLMSLAGYFLKVQSGRALNDAGTIIANIAAIFSNVKYNPPQSPYKSVTTPNPLDDVVNFANDVWSGAQNAYNDVASGLGAIETALKDLPKAIYQTFIHIPGLMWDTAVGGLGGAIADVFIWLFPYLLVFGAILLVGGLILKWAWPRVKAAGAGVEVAAQDRFRYELDRHGWHPFQALEARIRGPAPHYAPGVSSVGGPTGEVAQAPPVLQEVPGASPRGDSPPAEPAPPESVPPEAPPSAPETPEGIQAPPEVEKPVPVGSSTEETEEVLGDGYTEAKDRMRAALRARDARPEGAAVGA